MDDLSGLDWTSQRSQNAKKPLPRSSSSGFAALRPTPPVSGRSTPLNDGLSNPPSKPGTPANDTFSNLVAFNSSASGKNLSLQEQQKRLLQQKAEQEIARRKQLNEQYRGDDEHFWNNLGSGRNTPTPASQEPVASTGAFTNTGDEDDFLAAFNSTRSIQPLAHSAEAKIQQNGHATNSVQGRSGPSASLLLSEEQGSGFADDEDDDPFGLSQLKPAKISHVQAPSTQLDDDDVLGLLAKPVSEIRKPEKRPEEDEERITRTEVDSRNRALAELVDMGFSADKAEQALESTESRTDVSAAVSWLLQQAHAEARQQVEAQPRSLGSSRGSNGRNREERSGRSPVDEIKGGPEPRQQRRGDGVGTLGEKDPAQLAAELGNNFLKTAGSLWKTGTKRVQQAVQDFNSDSDSSQPRWMREGSSEQQATTSRRSPDDEPTASRRRRKSSAIKAVDPVTDEARMLESDHGRPPPKMLTRSRHESRIDSSADNSRDHSPAIASRLRESVPPKPAFLRQQQPAPTAPRASLTRQALEEQASQAYVSSARRRKPATQPLVSASEPDLLEAVPQQSLASRPSTTGPGRSPKPSTLLAVWPVPTPREIPPISSIALNASNRQREAGNAHYKRGDYSAAHQSYSTALSHLPRTHPIVIVILVNHALTSLKIGEPKTAISDADSAIKIVGPSKGESETVDLKNGETPKSMREFYGKALMRKAEALEQIEKWAEAAAVWMEAVEGGHGGATSIEGRIRAEKAANPQTSRSKAPPSKKPLSAPRHSAINDLSGKPIVVSSASSEAAVNRLRAANAAAEKADDEKFALADSVEARVVAWKGGKADNLRALLSSLELVLWPEAEWKKIGMAELVLPNKVKIQYMKGIAKVHPDKVSGSDLSIWRKGTDCDCLLDTNHCNNGAKDDCWRSIQHTE
jgi:tetratricopeptide (TPR) repeat protein